MQDDLIELPSNYSKLNLSLESDKLKYMNFIYKKITSDCDKDTYKISNEKISLFKFKDTNLMIVIRTDHYKSVVKNLLNFYIECEMYENCSLLNKIYNNIE